MTMMHTSIVLAVRDKGAAATFFANILGCDRKHTDASWTFLSRDKFRVMLGECPDVTPASEIGDHSYVGYVIVDNVDELYDDIVRRGGRGHTSTPETKPWGMREFGLRTPDGHRITFGQEAH